MAAKPTVRIVAAEIRRDGTWLVTQRLVTSVLPGLWEFPGGRVREGETDADALDRCLRDRLGSGCEVGELLMSSTHEYPAWEVTLSVYQATLTDAPTTARVQALRWVTPDQFADLEFPDADQKTIAALLSEA